VIFVDTSFWVALRNRRDAHNDDARRLFRAHGPARPVTTTAVRGETWTFLRRRVGPAAAVGFLEALDQTSRLRVVPVDERWDAEALAWLRRHDEREYSYVDATSFTVMRALGIREALAFDGDFAAAGFVELRT
jgi:predicted nucleic acid-binding protein